MLNYKIVTIMRVYSNNKSNMTHKMKKTTSSLHKLLYSTGLIVDKTEEGESALFVVLHHVHDGKFAEDVQFVIVAVYLDSLAKVRESFTTGHLPDRSSYEKKRKKN